MKKIILILILTTLLPVSYLAGMDGVYQSKLAVKAVANGALAGEANDSTTSGPVVVTIESNLSDVSSLMKKIIEQELKEGDQKKLRLVVNKMTEKREGSYADLTCVERMRKGIEIRLQRLCAVSKEIENEYENAADLSSHIKEWIEECLQLVYEKTDPEFFEKYYTGEGCMVVKHALEHALDDLEWALMIIANSKGWQEIDKMSKTDYKALVYASLLHDLSNVFLGRKIHSVVSSYLIGCLLDGEDAFNPQDVVKVMAIANAHHSGEVKKTFGLEIYDGYYPANILSDADTLDNGMIIERIFGIVKNSFGKKPEFFKNNWFNAKITKEERVDHLNKAPGKTFKDRGIKNDTLQYLLDCGFNHRIPGYYLTDGACSLLLAGMDAIGEEGKPVMIIPGYYQTDGDGGRSLFSENLEWEKPAITGIIDVLFNFFKQADTKLKENNKEGFSEEEKERFRETCYFVYEQRVLIKVFADAGLDYGAYFDEDRFPDMEKRVDAARTMLEIIIEKSTGNYREFVSLLRESVQPIFIIVGPPFSGKSKYADHLSRTLNLHRIETGQLLRDYLGENPEEPKLVAVRRAMENGCLADDEIVLSLIVDELKKSPCGSAGVIIDGCPRTFEQAKGLDDILKNNGFSVRNVIILDADDDALKRMFTDRMMKGASGDLSARSDDSEDVAEKRIAGYRERSQEIMNYFTRQEYNCIFVNVERDKCQHSVVWDILQGINGQDGENIMHGLETYETFRQFFLAKALKYLSDTDSGSRADARADTRYAWKVIKQVAAESSTKTPVANRADELIERFEGSDIVDIDASYGEGGGQAMRTSLALSVVLGKPFLMKNFRLPKGAETRRKEPGLRPVQFANLALVKDMLEHPLIAGFEIGSRSLTFIPSHVKSGKREFHMSLANVDPNATSSITKIVQSIAPIMIFADNPSSVIIEGNTHKENDLCPEYLQEVLVPVLEKMGIEMHISVEEYGFNRSGKGRVKIEVEKNLHRKDINSLVVTKKGNLERVDIFITASSECMPDETAIDRVMQNIRKAVPAGTKINIVKKEVDAGTSICNVLICGRYDNTVCGFDDVTGSEDEEDIGSMMEKLVEKFRRFHKSDAVVDEYLADMLVPYLLLSEKKCSIKVEEVTTHLETSVYIANKFFPGRLNLKKYDDGSGELVIESVSQSARSVERISSANTSP